MIFNLFKSKPTLKELIPNGFVDIHSHILPGIDDGAKNIEESLMLITEMKKMGFSKIIGTPHTYPGLYNNSNESIKNSFEKLKKGFNLDIGLCYASEYMIDYSLIKKAKDNKLMCIKENYVLIEMSYLAPPINLYEILYEIKVNGYVPILAHPERYLFIKSLKEYYKLKKYGCLFQANLLSATDYYGINVRKNLENLISKNLIDFVGSDIHSIRHVSAFNLAVKLKRFKVFEKIINNNLRQFSTN